MSLVGPRILLALAIEVCSAKTRRREKVIQRGNVRFRPRWTLPHNSNGLPDRLRWEGQMKRQVAFAVLSWITFNAAARGETWPYENWQMYGKDLSHTFSNPLSQVNPGNVGSLMPAWTFPTGDAVSASPAVVDGVVYVGSWDGFSMPSMPRLASFDGRSKWTANRR